MHYFMQSIILTACFALGIKGLRCYICGTSDDTKNEHSTSCVDFQVDDPQFNRECGTGSKSCRLARKVSENVILSRSCEQIPLNDCKVANSIEYCFCTKDLCNKINTLDDEEGDDEHLEDSAEGSGTEKINSDILDSDSINKLATTIKNFNDSVMSQHDNVNKNAIDVNSSCSKCQFYTYLVASTLYALG
ncbi:uncharacterized protein [Euwallacea similis]|uniref:uncharacterized protein n=1 Tax=Euwallacea similis TaxID=1736056 RepID=UPI00344BF953